MAAACRSCDAPIRWAITDTEKWIPVDDTPRTDGNLVLFHLGGQVRARAVRLPDDQMQPRFVAHFTTCPKAHQHRRKK